MKNIMIITNNDERMQGIIRGIESIDAEHRLNIIYGAGDSTVTEVQLIMADLAEATLLITEEVQVPAHPQGKAITQYLINIPDSDRQTIIEYMQDNCKHLIDTLDS